MLARLFESPPRPSSWMSQGTSEEHAAATAYGLRAKVHSTAEGNDQARSHMGSARQSACDYWILRWSVYCCFADEWVVISIRQPSNNCKQMVVCSFVAFCRPKSMLLNLKGPFQVMKAALKKNIELYFFDAINNIFRSTKAQLSKITRNQPLTKWIRN